MLEYLQVAVTDALTSFLMLKLRPLIPQLLVFGQIKQLMVQLLGSNLFWQQLSRFFRVVFLILISLNFTIISQVIHFLIVLDASKITVTGIRAC